VLPSEPFLEPGADAGKEEDDELPERGQEFCEEGKNSRLCQQVAREGRSRI